MQCFTRNCAGILLASLALSACTGGGNSGDDTPATQTGSFDYLEMFVNIADNVIIPGYEALQQSSKAMAETNGAIEQYCSAITEGNADTQKANAQQSWKDTMAALQKVMVHQIGPVAENEGALQHRLITPADSRVSYCGIDQSVILASQDDSFSVSSRLTNQRGMYAIEYLLFSDDLKHNCPVQIIETRDWNERDKTQRQLLRCNYAQQLATDVADAANDVLTAWQTQGGNYRATFAHPNNRETAIEQLSDAMFYIELNVKDDKLGPPLALHNSCNRLACPDRVKSPFSRTSLVNIDNNIAGAQHLFNGGNGLSLDDLINSAGLPSVTTRFNRELSELRNYLAQIETPLIDQTEKMLTLTDNSECINSAANPDNTSSISACAAFGYLKRVTDTLRTDFVTALNTDLPDRAQSDND